MSISELYTMISDLCTTAGWEMFYDDSQRIRMQHRELGTCCPIAAVHVNTTGLLENSSGGAVYTLAHQLGVSRRDAEMFIRSVDFGGGGVVNLTWKEIRLHLSCVQLMT